MLGPTVWPLTLCVATIDYYQISTTDRSVSAWCLL